MSLTSYRAAPPRVQRKSLRDLSRRRNRFAVMPYTGANCRRRFVSCKGRTVGTCDRLPRYFWPIIAERTAYGGPFVSAWAVFVQRRFCVALGRPGSDRLSRVLRRSTIGAGAFHGRVRNGNGCSRPAITTRSAKRNKLRSWQAFACFIRRTFCSPCEHVLGFIVRTNAERSPGDEH